MITLARTCTAFGEIAILRSRVKGSHIYCQEDWFQSEADRHGVSLATYVHAFGLLAQSTAHEVLMIGYGGGTLATMLSKAGRLVTVVNINPHSIALAQRYFSLPADVTCYVEDGASFLKLHAKPFDAIVIDAFLGDRVPPHLCSLEFFQLVRQRLAPSECVFFNVFLQRGSDPSADGIADSMIDAEFEVRVLEPPAPVERNTIVMGGAVADLRPPTLLAAPEVLQDEITAELELKQFRHVWRSWNPIAGFESAANCSESQTP